MMMTKKLMLITLLAGSAFASVAQAADGTINFTGKIIDTACVVSPASKSVNVSFGEVSKDAFNGVGSSTAPTQFSIVLTNCPVAVTSAVVLFDGPVDQTNRKLLKVSAATGVGIGIFEEDTSTLIPIATRSASRALTPGADTTFNFVAKYVATVAAVTIGEANATTEFTVSYN